MNSKKILYVLLSLFPGGMENGIINLINNSSSNYEHIICCLRDKGPFCKRLNSKVKIIELHMKKGGNDYTLPFKLLNLLIKTKIDLVRAFNEDPLFYSIFPSLITRTPLIYYNGGRTYPEKKRKLLLEKHLGNLATVVVVPSRELGDYLYRVVGIKRKKIRVIPNGVAITRFEKNIDIMKKKSELQIDPKDTVIGTVGRMVNQKDYPTFLEVARRVLKVRNDTSFIIIGDGALREELENITRLNGTSEKVKFLGIREDIEDLYKIMDIYVSTTKWEGMSNVLLEAMASKKAVITTKVEGTNALIENGVNGFTIDKPGDVNSFVETILNLNKKQQSVIGYNAYNKVKKDFSFNKTLERYEKLYQDITG